MADKTVVAELSFEGSPLVVTEVTERRDGSSYEEVILSNGRSQRVQITATDRAGFYFFHMVGGKGGRSLHIYSKISLRFSGLTSGETTVISVAEETGELKIDSTR